MNFSVIYLVELLTLVLVLLAIYRVYRAQLSDCSIAQATPPDTADRYLESTPKKPTVSNERSTNVALEAKLSTRTLNESGNRTVNISTSKQIPQLNDCTPSSGSQVLSTSTSMRAEKTHALKHYIADFF